MRVYECLEEYLGDEANIGDKITIEGFGQLDSLIPNSRHDTFTVVDIFRGNITVRRYQMKTRELIEVEGGLAVLSAEEYKALKKDY